MTFLTSFSPLTLRRNATAREEPTTPVSMAIGTPSHQCITRDLLWWIRRPSTPFILLAVLLDLQVGAEPKSSGVSSTTRRREWRRKRTLSSHALLSCTEMKRSAASLVRSLTELCGLMWLRFRWVWDFAPFAHTGRCERYHCRNCAPWNLWPRNFKSAIERIVGTQN